MRRYERTGQNGAIGSTITAHDVRKPSRYERGLKDVPAEHIKLIAAALDMEPNLFYDQTLKRAPANPWADVCRQGL